MMLMATRVFVFEFVFLSAVQEYVHLQLGGCEGYPFAM